MKIKILSLIAILPLIANMLGVIPVLAENTENDFKFFISGGKSATISGYSGSEEDIVIPSVIEGYPVTRIAQQAFYFRENIKSVIIPDSINYIGNSAFLHCSALEKVFIPDSVTNIGAKAFKDCIKLKEINIPNGITKISDSTFHNCGSLYDITIPDSVTSIGRYAFWGTKYFNMNDWESGYLYIGNHLIELLHTHKGAYTIREGTKSIAAYALQNCKSLTDISIPDSVVTIGNKAFSDCSSLTNIILPDSVTNIGANAFERCTNLKEINIPDSVTTISHAVFLSCDSLEHITLPESITSIGTDAFSGSAIREITIPDSVTYIDDHAFMGCHNLANIKLSENIVYISSNAFYNTKLINDKNNWDEGVLYINGCLISMDKNFSGSYMIRDGTKVISNHAFSNCTGLTSITIPDSISRIGLGAFSHCSNLSSIIIPQSVKRIDDYAFSNCDSLTSITLPSSLAYLGSSVFEKCKKLKQITIPDSVTYLGNAAFKGCESLTEITIPEGITEINDRLFENCVSLTDITLPDTITNIKESAFLNTGYYNDETNWENNLLYIEPYLIYARENADGNYIVRDGTKVIGSMTFGYTADYLKSIAIPDSVIAISYGAFFNCPHLQDVYYYGTEHDWYNKISISAQNDFLYWADVHFSSEITCDIIYDANGGINAPNPQQARAKSNFILTHETPVRNGYIFRGWSRSAHSTKAELKKGDEISTDTDNITLYAVWEPTAAAAAKLLMRGTFNAFSFITTKIPLPLTW